MQKLVIGMSVRNIPKGFTLLEILIVIVIISISINFAVLAFGDFGEKTKITHAAENFMHLISVVRKEAILADETMAIRINRDNYEVLKLNNNSWQILKNSVYQKTTIPKGTIINLINNQQKPKNNFIIINAAGRVTPFRLTFSKNPNKIITAIICDSFGNLKIDNKQNAR